MSDSTSQPSSRAAKSGKSRYFQERSSTVISSEVLSLQSRKSFEYLFCFHRTLGISPVDLEGFKADIALETLIPPPHPGETWGIRQLKEKKEEKVPP